MEGRHIPHYSSDMHILLVGEGDFSFASALASTFQNASRLLATSLDSLETLKTRYPHFIRLSLEALERAGAAVLHEVDVKRMAEDPRVRNLSFDRIIFNFPHSGFTPCFSENSMSVIKRHRELMREFFKNASKLVQKKGGEVHVTHHVHEPYAKWNLVEEAALSGLSLVGTPTKFEPLMYPGYTNRRGAGIRRWGRTFPRDKAATFIFAPLPST